MPLEEMSPFFATKCQCYSCHFHWLITPRLPSTVFELNTNLLSNNTCFAFSNLSFNKIFIDTDTNYKLGFASFQFLFLLKFLFISQLLYIESMGISILLFLCFLFVFKNNFS